MSAAATSNIPVTITPPNQTIGQMFGQDRIAQLMPLAQTYAPVLSPAVSFFANPSNNDATLSALDVLGLPTYYPGDVWRSHNGWCEAYLPLNDLYYLAMLFKKYPMPDRTANNCRALQGYIAALDQERIAVEQKFVGDNSPCPHTSGLNAVATLQGIYRGMYAGMSCDYAIQQQQDQENQDDAQQIQDHAAQLQLEAQERQAAIAAAAAQNAAALQLEANKQAADNTANVAGTGTKGTNSYLVYGIIGAAVLLMAGAFMIFKNKNKQ